MPAGVDHVADINGTELHRLSKLYELPDYVKSADYDKTFRPGRVPINVYADVVRRQFPCHTSASTWLSNAYFQEKRAEFHEKDARRIESRLQHYIKFWGIENDVKAFNEKCAAYQAESDDDLPDSAFGYVKILPNGRKERRLRMANSLEVKSASDWLFNYRDSIPYRDKNSIAKRILEKAARFGTSLSSDSLEFLERCSGRGVCDPKELKNMIEKRAYLTRIDEHRTRLKELAESVRDAPAITLQPNMLVKLAELIDDYDRAVGLTGKYGEVLERPEDVIFRATFTKAASDCERLVEMTSGTVYDKSDLSKIALEDIRDVFGDDFVEEVADGNKVDMNKLGENLSTLPLPDAQTFDLLCREIGISPELVKD